jgi:hypothetical protein
MCFWYLFCFYNIVGKYRSMSSLPFFLRRKRQLFSLLTAPGHRRQNKLCAFRSIFPFFSYWIVMYVTAVYKQIDLEYLFLFLFLILTPILPRLALGSLYCEIRCRIISVCILCVSWSRHAFLESERETKLNMGRHIDHKR